jgi:organic radical activating enzyme
VYDPRKELKRYTTTDLLEIVKNQPTRMVVITGGEPLLQGSRLVSLLFELLNAGYRIEIETNGTILPAWSKTSLGLELLEDIHFNVSPKLSNSGNDVLKRINPKAMDWFVANPNAVFKFVCLNEKDLKEIEAYQYDFEIPSSRIYVMPEGRSNSEIQNHLGLLASSVLRKEWNLTTRLQVVLYGDRRGV